MGGVPIDGWMSVTIGRNSDNSSQVLSADGRVGYTKVADKTGMFELEVQQQNNSVNTYLAALQQAQDSLDDLIFMEIVVSDKSGGVLADASNCHLQKPSNQDLAAESGSRNWSFFVEELDYRADPDGFLGKAAVIDAATASVTSLLARQK
jgi:hypothetical protein